MEIVTYFDLEGQDKLVALFRHRPGDRRIHNLKVQMTDTENNCHHDSTECMTITYRLLTEQDSFMSKTDVFT